MDCPQSQLMPIDFVAMHCDAHQLPIAILLDVGMHEQPPSLPSWICVPQIGETVQRSNRVQQAILLGYLRIPREKTNQARKISVPSHFQRGLGPLESARCALLRREVYFLCRNSCHQLLLPHPPFRVPLLLYMQQSIGERQLFLSQCSFLQKAPAFVGFS